MAHPRIYLDHAATSPLRPEALTAMARCWELHLGNPSSVHAAGRVARSSLDDARDRLAAVLGCAAREIVLTSGGTEADNLALRGLLERWGDTRGRHIVVSAIEHGAVLGTAERLEAVGAAEVTVVPCDAHGRIDPGAVAAAVRPDTLLVSVMAASNEVGTVQDVPAIAAAVRERNPQTLVHTDAVQALGRMPLTLGESGADLMTVTAHKLGGPVGVGALVVRHGVFLSAQLTGGGQERGRRSGTENVAGAAGFAAAAELAVAELPEAAPRMRRLADALTETILGGVPGSRLTGHPELRLPGHVSLVLPGCRTDVLLARLDAGGLCASGGSACASGAPVPSHVLTAMGVTAEEAACALRLTLGRTTTEAEVERAGRLVVAAAEAVRGAVAAS